MAAKDQIESDALAAEWGVALNGEQNGTGAPPVDGQSANPSETMASQ